MDPFDALLRQRMTRLLAAVPVEPAPEPSRALPMTGRRMVRKRLILAVGLGLLLLTSLAVSLPTQSRPTNEARLRALGVPEGVEIIGAAGSGGNLLTVPYRDRDGQVHCVGRCRGMSVIGPSGRVVYAGPSPPTPTPGP